MYEIRVYERGRAWEAALLENSLDEAEKVMGNLAASLYEKYDGTEMKRFEIRITEITDHEVVKVMRLI